jgi:monothiol glutaredoxin
MSDAQTQIDQLVKSNDIVLFMKGNASFPMCGFSGRAIQILKACGVDPKTVKTVNVLEDEGVRHGIKEYSNWPTIPQLYVKGEFVGGSDIMMEMYESGELQQVINFGRLFCAFGVRRAERFFTEPPIRWDSGIFTGFSALEISHPLCLNEGVS